MGCSYGNAQWRVGVGVGVGVGVLCLCLCLRMFLRLCRRVCVSTGQPFGKPEAGEKENGAAPPSDQDASSPDVVSPFLSVCLYACLSVCLSVRLCHAQHTHRICVRKHLRSEFPAKSFQL